MKSLLYELLLTAVRHTHTDTGLNLNKRSEDDCRLLSDEDVSVGFFALVSSGRRLLIVLNEQ